MPPSAADAIRYRSPSSGARPCQDCADTCTARPSDRARSYSCQIGSLRATALNSSTASRIWAGCAVQAGPEPPEQGPEPQRHVGYLPGGGPGELQLIVESAGRVGKREPAGIQPGEEVRAASRRSAGSFD